MKQHNRGSGSGQHHRSENPGQDEASPRRTGRVFGGGSSVEIVDAHVVPASDCCRIRSESPGARGMVSGMITVGRTLTPGRRDAVEVTARPMCQVVIASFSARLPGAGRAELPSRSRRKLQRSGVRRRQGRSW